MKTFYVRSGDHIQAETAQAAALKYLRAVDKARWPQVVEVFDSSQVPTEVVVLACDELDPGE